MKRLLIASLLTLALIALAGCGRKSTPAPTATPNPPAATEAPQAAPTAAEPAQPESTTALESEPAPTNEVATEGATKVITETETLTETAALAAIDTVTESVSAPVVVDFWTGDTEPSRIAVYEAVALRFMAENPGVEVRITPVDEESFTERATAAVANGEGPDLARVGMESLAALVASNLIDANAANTVVDAVGRDDFRERPLEMVTSPTTGQAFAVPYDGWLQALWYRRDLFEENGLTNPVSWEDINAACDQLVASRAVPAALVLPTDPSQTYVEQVFEEVAMSNNAWPFDDDGNVTMNTPEMIEALRFYTDLQRCSPPAPQGLYSAREAYESGQSAMLFYSTYIMDDLVEGSERKDGTRVPIAVDGLAGKTGFASGMVGPNGSASYGQLVTLAILKDAPPETQAVAAYFLTKGYYDIIKTAPLGKVPVLKSAIQDWTALSPVFTYYSDATLGHIASGYDVMNRWIFRPEYGPSERLAIGKLQTQLLIPQAISQIVIDGTTPEEAAAWLQAQVEAIQAEFQAQG